MTLPERLLLEKKNLLNVWSIVELFESLKSVNGSTVWLFEHAGLVSHGWFLGHEFLEVIGDCCVESGPLRKASV